MSTRPSSPTPTSEHPPLETLAAFADGRLQGDAQRRTVRHLADCDLCREVVAETVHLGRDPDLAAVPEPDDGSEDEITHRESGRVLVPPATRFRRRLPLIGALVAAGVAALLAWTVVERAFLSHELEPVALADLGAQLDESSLRETVPEMSVQPGDLQFKVVRGGGDDLLAHEEPQTSQQAYRLGFHLSLLNAAVRIGDYAKAADVLRSIEYQGDLESPSLVGIQLAVDGEAPALRGKLAQGADPQEILSDLGDVDARLDGRLDDAGPALDFPRWYALGKWAGAAWLATASGDMAWFDDPKTKAQLHALRQQEWGSRTDPALASVTGLVVSAGDVKDVETLREALKNLNRAAGNDSNVPLPGFAAPAIDVTPPAGVDSSETPADTDTPDRSDTPDSPTPDGDAP